MSLFKTKESNEQARKRRGAALLDTGTDLDKRVAAVEELTKDIGQLAVVHDVRLRELATLLRVVMVPQTSSFSKRCTAVDEGWKDKLQEYTKRRKQTGQTEQIGSKHLKLAQGMFEEMYAHPKIKPQVKQFLELHWKDTNQETEDFLARDEMEGHEGREKRHHGIQTGGDSAGSRGGDDPPDGGRRRHGQDGNGSSRSTSAGPAGQIGGNVGQVGNKRGDTSSKRAKEEAQTLKEIGEGVQTSIQTFFQGRS